MECSNVNAGFSKIRIIKNLTVIALSFLLIFTAYDGLSMLQTTMNKEEGVGTASQAIIHISFGLSSLLLSSYVVKKLGTKNTQLLGMSMYLPYIAANFYPSWITLVPSAIIIGIGCTLLWGAQCTYLNECSVLYKELTDASTDTSPTPRVTYISNKEGTEEVSALNLLQKADGSQNPLGGNENSPPDRYAVQSTYLNGCPVLNEESTDASTAISPTLRVTYMSNKEGAKEVSAVDLLQKADRSQNPQVNGGNSQSKHLPPDRYGVTPSPWSPREANATLKKENKIFELHTPNNVQNKHNKKSRSLSSTNALFFGFHGLAYCSAQVWSNLISFYVLSSGQAINYSNTSNCSCGANFCNIDQECVNSRIEEVPADIRYIYTGLCVACGIVAVLLIWLFVDHMDRSKNSVTLSWNHIFATIKFIKNKEQLFLIPLTISTSIFQGFYTADFTKSYIACSLSTSHVGLVTVFYGVASALSSIISGLLIRQFGRRVVLILCQTINIVSLVLLYLWIPDVHQPLTLYLAGGIFGFIVGIYHSQTKALYGVFFQGDEATAFSSKNMYSSIGWALPFVYGEFFCTSVKLCIMFTIACLGLIGYLLAERSFSLRNKQN